MTGAQRRVLEAIALVGSVHGADISNEARRALVTLGLIEPCSGTSLGWYRLTHSGREAVDAQRRSA